MSESSILTSYNWITWDYNLNNCSLALENCLARITRMHKSDINQRYIIFTHALFFAVALIHQILQMWRQFKFSGRPDHWKPKSHFKISINMAIRVMKHAQIKTFFWKFAHFLHFLEIWNFSGTNQKSFSFLREVWLIFNLWYPWLEFRWKYGAVAWNQIFGKNIYPWLYKWVCMIAWVMYNCLLCVVL